MEPIVSTSSDVFTRSESTSRNEFRVYKRRYFLLATLFMLNLSNAMVWLTFGPVAYKAAQVYDTNLDAINFLSLVFMITAIPCGMVATWLIDTIGLRFSVILSAWLNCIGAVIRVVSVVDGIPQEGMLPLVFVGQTIAAFAQPFVLFAPTKLSALWFADDERAVANMLATIANPLGIMVSNILSPYLALTATRSDMLFMLGIQCIPAGLAVLMATLGWWSSKPPTPPSISAEATSLSFIAGLKLLMRNFSYYILALAVGAGIALFSVLTTLLSQILCPWGYTDTFVGTACAASLIGAGCVGAAIAGVYVDKTKRFTEVTKVGYMVAVAALVVFAVMQNRPGESVVLALMCGIFGFFGLPVYPIGNELAVETTYPVGEATSSGIVFMFGQLQGIILVIVMQSIGKPLTKAEVPNNTCTSDNLGQVPITDMSIPVYVMVAYAGLVAIIYLVFFRTDYKRLLSERIESSEDDVLPVEDQQHYTSGKPETRRESFGNDKTDLCPPAEQSTSNYVEHSEKF